VFSARVRKWIGMWRMQIFQFWECASDGKDERCGRAWNGILRFLEEHFELDKQLHEAD